MPVGVHIAAGQDNRADCRGNGKEFILAGCGGARRSAAAVGALPEKVAAEDRAPSQNRALMAGAVMVDTAGDD